MDEILCPRVDGLVMTCDQGIVDDHIVSAVEKVFSATTADIAGSAGNENIHGIPLFIGVE